ncbi:MAG TPA: YlzJ-like family protein [Clostridia bacterium]|nr:YlzJ-like family protein [Clostridia bacterium]
MILYSIVPPEIVFQNYPEYDIAGGKKSDVVEADYRGERVLVRRSADNQFELVRLLSTCPATFLKKDFQMGITIDERDLKINS